MLWAFSIGEPHNQITLLNAPSGLLGEKRMLKEQERQEFSLDKVNGSLGTIAAIKQLRMKPLETRLKTL